MRVVVHIGATKTASTYVQRCLARNENVLAECGIYLPRAGRRSGNVTHHNLAWEMLGDVRFRPENGDWSALREEVAHLGAETVVLTSEAFARVAADPKLRTTLATRLFDLSGDVEILYVVRDPLARINSMYAQIVKTFSMPLTFEEYATKSTATGFYNLERSFQFWYRSSKAKFTALRFDEFVKRGPFLSFIEALHVDVPSDELDLLESKANVTPGPMSIVAMQLLGVELRVIDPEFRRRSPAAMKLSTTAQRRAEKEGWNEDRFWAWQPELAKKATTSLARSNDRFARAVWGTSWPLDEPIDRERTAIDLIDAGAKKRKAVANYVEQMIKRYVKYKLRPHGAKGLDETQTDSLDIEADDAERALERPKTQSRIPKD